MRVDLDTYIRKLRDQLEGFDDFAARLMMQETNSTLTKVKQNIREQGVPGEAYSEGYSAFRAKKGRQTSKVDLTFSGRMMNNTQIQKIEPKGQGILVASIGPSQSLEKTKFNANQKRFGNFLKVQPKELEEFKKNYTNEVVRYLNDE